MTSADDLHNASPSDLEKSTSVHQNPAASGQRRRRVSRARGFIGPITADADGTPILDMLESWRLALESTNKSAGTITSYVRTIQEFAAWLEDNGVPATIEDVTPKHIRSYLAEELEQTSPGNADKHRRNLSVFWNWLEDEEERTDNPMRRIKRIKVPVTSGDVFTDEELRALLAVCEGKDFESRRDLAIIRIFIDTGIRVSGMADLKYLPDDPEESDVDLTRRRLHVLLKGGKKIWVPIGAKATAALDRYLRVRRRHKAASSPYLWLPNRNLRTRAGEVRLTATGIHQMIDRRAAQAGVVGAHPHKFRRTMAVRWEGDSLTLMDIGGWESLDMVRHYQRAGREQRAHAEHRRLSPGDKI